MVRLAIVGSRDFGSSTWDATARDLVRRYVRQLPAGTIIVSGGARGADTYAYDAAKECGYQTEIYPAAWTRPDGTTDRGAGHRRNAVIVANCDELVAFRRAGGKSAGTDHVVGLARKAGKPVRVVEVGG